MAYLSLLSGFVFYNGCGLGLLSHPAENIIAAKW